MIEFLALTSIVFCCTLVILLYLYKKRLDDQSEILDLLIDSANFQSQEFEKLLGILKENGIK